MATALDDGITLAAGVTVLVAIVVVVASVFVFEVAAGMADVDVAGDGVGVVLPPHAEVAQMSEQTSDEPASFKRVAMRGANLTPARGPS